MSGKNELRAAMREKRRALDEKQQSAASQAVYARITALTTYREAACVMAYMACRGELDLSLVIRDAHERGKTLALPRCEAPGVMTARRVDSLSQLVRGAHGLMEPDESCEVIAPDRIGLILVPGTAFDRNGGRLGQGGGYYDRFLKETSACRAGVCHGFALVDHVPIEAHDIRMDAVITPDECYTVRRNP